MIDFFLNDKNVTYYTGLLNILYLVVALFQEVILQDVFGISKPSCCVITFYSLSVLCVIGGGALADMIFLV